MKPKDNIWSFFDVTGEGSKKIARCKGCKMVVSAKSERLKAHRHKCCGDSGEPDTQENSDPICSSGDINSTSEPLSVDSIPHTPAKS